MHIIHVLIHMDPNVVRLKVFVSVLVTRFDLEEFSFYLFIKMLVQYNPYHPQLC